MCALEYLHKKNNKIFSILLSFLMLVLLFSATLFLSAQEVKEYDSNVGEILEFGATSQANQVQPPAVIAPPVPPSSAVTEPAVSNTVQVAVPSRQPSYPVSVPAQQSVPVQNSLMHLHKIRHKVMLLLNIPLHHKPLQYLFHQ